MEVKLIDHTGAGRDSWHAARLMVFTKSTRLKVSPEGWQDILGWTAQKLTEELAYMANTIRSSWEFCNYTFVLTGVTRAFTHQLVRHRTGSYAQQTQQILKVEATDVVKPMRFRQRDSQETDEQVWDDTIQAIADGYEELLRQGATVEEARGLLPTNISTNIVAKFDLRTLVDVFHQRISPRNLGEFREVAIKMRDEVLRVHPWAEVFINSDRDRAMAQLDLEIQSMMANPYEPRSADFENSSEARNKKMNGMLKLVDQLRREG